MYGVIVVPTSASAARNAACSGGRLGIVSPSATFPQSGPMMNALSG